MPRIAPSRLRSFVADLAIDFGTAEDAAHQLARSLVGADLCGHRSHGSRLLAAKYAPEIADGKIVPAATARIDRADDVFVTVDGQRAFGQVVAHQAIDAGIRAADEHGIGVVSVRNVSHIGRVGEWAERAAAADKALVGLVANPGSQWVAPPGSAHRRFSTNPIVIGIPSYDALPFPLVLDMASAQIARSRIREHDTATEPLPEGWVVDETGASVTDPSVFEAGEGAILPLGGLLSGHKGFGLAVMGELMAGNASDGSVSGMQDVTWGNHGIFYLTDLDRLTTPEAVSARVRAIATYVRETQFSSAVPTPPTMDDAEALLPGEPEHRIRERRRHAGIPVPDGDVALLTALAAERGRRDAVPAVFH